jgi:hypothetical protein
LRLLSPPEALTSIQRDLLLHVALYNATGKIPWLMANHPRAALRDHPEIVAAICGVRPGFGDHWRPPAETFLSTRTFRLNPVDDDPRGSETRVLLPLVDLLNHHRDGARLTLDERAMTVANAHPLSGDECFAHYGGRRDVLDLALQYGYVDRHTAIARSAPVKVEIREIGEVRVKTASQRRNHPMDPPRIEVTERGLVLSHLTFHARHPEWARTSLALAVTSIGLRNGLPPEKANRVAEEAFTLVVQANRLMLENVMTSAHQLRGVIPAQVVSQAAAAQAALIAAVPAHE